MGPGERDERVQLRHDRIDLDASIKHKAIVDHFMLLNNLEMFQGLDLDVFTDVYGESSLDGTNESAQKLLENWQKLYEALGQPGTQVLIYNLYEDTHLKVYNAADASSAPSSSGPAQFNAIAPPNPTDYSYYRASGFLFETSVDTKIEFKLPSADANFPAINIIDPSNILWIADDRSAKSSASSLARVGSEFDLSETPNFNSRSIIVTSQAKDDFFEKAFVKVDSKVASALAYFRELFTDKHFTK